MVKRRTCSKCAKPGHRADRCPTATALRKPVRRRRLAVVPTAAPSNGKVDEKIADLVARAQYAARELVKAKLDEELVMARAYVAELERLASA